MNIHAIAAMTLLWSAGIAFVFWPKPKPCVQVHANGCQYVTTDMGLAPLYDSQGRMVCLPTDGVTADAN